MITEADRAFAKALVSLAREHGAGKLSVDFSLRSAKNHMEKNEDGSYLNYEDVKMHWEEGRHGSKQPIHLSASVFVQVTEDAPAMKTESNS
jgi:hypothetical protein